MKGENIHAVYDWVSLNIVMYPNKQPRLHDNRSTKNTEITYIGEIFH